MSVSGILLADGPSDLPLAGHLEWIFAELGRSATIIPIDPRLMRSEGHTVSGRLRFLVQQQFTLDVAFVHRDAEGHPSEVRRGEVLAGAAAFNLSYPVIPVIPVRMTEAWLLLDEAAIRAVAGRPSGKQALALPTPATVERVADPKQMLREALLAASGTSGRKRSQFDRDFGRHRRLLLERLDPTGPVSGLSAWIRLRESIAEYLATLEVET